MFSILADLTCIILLVVLFYNLRQFKKETTELKRSTETTKKELFALQSDFYDGKISPWFF